MHATDHLAVKLFVPLRHLHGDAMTRMFGERINEFVLSIGVTDDDTFFGTAEINETWHPTFLIFV